MTKPTVLILLVVYLASILIVGIFGMQVMSFNNINYIESITISKEHIAFSDNGDTLIFEETLQEEAIPYVEYRATFRYKKNMTITVNPIIKAVDPTEDASDDELVITIQYEKGFENCITYDKGIFTVNKTGMATVIYNSKDGSKQRMMLILKALI